MVEMKMLLRLQMQSSSSSLVYIIWYCCNIRYIYIMYTIYNVLYTSLYKPSLPVCEAVNLCFASINLKRCKSTHLQVRIAVVKVGLLSEDVWSKFWVQMVSDKLQCLKPASASQIRLDAANNLSIYESINPSTHQSIDLFRTQFTCQIPPGSFLFPIALGPRHVDEKKSKKLGPNFNPSHPTSTHLL